MLFPPGLAKPRAIVWVWIVPQALLLGWNLDAWQLASGEAGASERNAALVILIGQLVSLAIGATLATHHALRGRLLSRVQGAGLLAAASILLGIAFLEGQNAIPAALRDWILPPDQWLFKQFALVMPGALYGAFRAICPNEEGAPFVNASAMALAVLAPFAIGFFAMTLFPGINVGGASAGHLVAPLYLASSVLLTAALLRLCVSIYAASRRNSPAALAIVTAVVAIILPLSGLALNAAIPFPTDFQIPAIYLLALANGVVLCLPNFAHPLAHRVVWLLQCAFLPFTLYFFAVFLPMLPLMPLAILFLGLGTLIAVPSLLFVLHSYRILDGWSHERRDGSRWIIGVLGVAAFACGPALLTIRILADRHALHAALDYLSYPDHSHSGTFTGDRGALRSALLRMQEFKQGRYLPYYSEFYNALAFDRLVLPHQKLENTWRAFTGMSLPDAATTNASPTFFFGNGSGRNAQEVLDGPVGDRPSSDAVTASLETTTIASSGRVQARVRVSIHNPTNNVTEYAAALHIPDGVFMTGMWLTIGAERVPARLFEQRAAEWVYQKITEVRPVPQDPAILRFTGPNSADLRVYPVEANSGRLVEIEFSYPDNLQPAITLDARRLELPAAVETRSRITDDGASAWIPAEALRHVPTIRRAGQPHLVLDTSLRSNLCDPERLRSAIARALGAYPDADTARITFANFGTRDFRGGAPVPIPELCALDPSVLLTAAGAFEGGFLETRAIQSVLAQSMDPERIHRFRPEIVVVRGSSDPEVRTDADSLADFARLAPDVASYRIVKADGKVNTVPFPHPSPIDDGPVRILRLGGRMTVVSAGTDAFLQANKCGIRTLPHSSHCRTLASRASRTPRRHGSSVSAAFFNLR